MAESIEQALTRLNCEHWRILDVLLKKPLTNARREMIRFTMPCGHEKQCAAKQLLKPLKCEQCYLMECYGYSVEDLTLKCPDCGEIMHHVPRTNLHAWTCWHCRENPSAEFQLLKLLHEKLKDRPGCYVTRNAQYPKTSIDEKAKTADGAVFMNGVRVLIEVDDAGHLTREGRRKHYAKDELVTERGLRLIRVYSGNICDVLAEAIIDRIDRDLIKEGEVKLIVGSDAALEFFDKLYPDCGNTGDNEAVEEDAEIPIDEPEDEEIAIETLKEEFTSRLEELCEYYLDVINSNSPICKDLEKLIALAESIAILADSGNASSSIIIKWMTAATSILVHNGRKLNLTADQKIEEQDTETTTTTDLLKHD